MADDGCVGILPGVRVRLTRPLPEQLAIPARHPAELAHPPLIGHERDGAGALGIRREIMTDSMKAKTAHIALRCVVEHFGKRTIQRPTRRVRRDRDVVQGDRRGEMLGDIGSRSPDDRGVRMTAVATIAGRRRSAEIGRASCRERV